MNLDQNSPNPFNPQTTIRFTVSQPDNVTLKIYDLRGREIATLVDEQKIAGQYQVVWNGTDNRGIHVGSGIYLYCLQVGQTLKTKKMMLIK